MTEADFLDFARSAALRVTNDVGRIGHLVFTQTKNTKEPTLREPEMRTAFQQEAEERGLFYGIEVPTSHQYQFTGIGKRRALTDFALLDSDSPISNRNVLVEFKQGQPNRVRSALDATFDYPKITKDVHKLWAEPAQHGRCMFHICQAADAGTLDAIKEKYNTVTQNAMNLALETLRHNNSAPSNAWFLLLILVLHERGATRGSFLHHATWNGNEWSFLESEQLSLSIQ